MEQEVRLQLTNIITNITSPLFLSNLLTIEVFEEVDSIPKVRDLWILVVAITYSLCEVLHFEINVLFVVGDKIVRIEHSRVESKALVW
jgi:hypothetical protein